MCKFNEAWIGICNGENVEGKDYCRNHLQEKCIICGSQATHNCAETMPFVCSLNLCDNLGCKLEHFYITHGYAFFEISDLEKKLNKTSKLVISKVGFKTSNKFHDRYNEKHKDVLQIKRLVYLNDGKIQLYNIPYKYRVKENFKIPQLFEGTFYEEEIKKIGLYYIEDTLFLDKVYTKDIFPKLKKVNWVNI